MSAPRWSKALLRWMAPSGREDEVAGDLEEAHRARVRRRGWLVASVLTGLEALDMASVLLRERICKRRGARKTDGPERGPLFSPSTGFGFSWLDFKLGIRMLVRYPGLTLVSGCAIAVAVGIGGFSYVVMLSIADPRLPLDDGDRVVVIQTWDAVANQEDYQSLHDFFHWREELESLEDLSASRFATRNLIVADGAGAPVVLAEMTASGFRVARVSPLLGRALLEGDEREGAPLVIVIGYDVWQSHFFGDPSVIGRSVQVDGVSHTVVGVMPEGFAFPLYFEAWTPMRLDPLAYQQSEGPAIIVFGRLGPGISQEKAHTELMTLGFRRAQLFPGADKQLQPRILSLPEAWQGQATDPRMLFEVLAFVSLVLGVIFANVAVLFFARTATRLGEIAARATLGASRSRIVTQLFVEAIVLSAPAAIVGLLLTRKALTMVFGVLSDQYGGHLPFWMSSDLSAGTIFYVMGLTVFGAAVVGVLPAIKTTGRGLSSTLSRVGSRTGVQLGATWTILIVAQVGFAVAVLPGVGFTAMRELSTVMRSPGFPTDQFLTASLVMSTEWAPSGRSDGSSSNSPSDEALVRFHENVADLKRLMEAETSVTATTIASGLPGMENGVWIEADGPTAMGASGFVRTASISIDRDFFNVFDVPLLSGRPFDTEDQNGTTTAVIVNEAFVREVLGGGGALGRRLRFRNEVTAEESTGVLRWYEVIGVVGDVPPKVLVSSVPMSRIYRPLAPGQFTRASLALSVSKAAQPAVVSRIREVTASLDAALQVDEILPLDNVLRGRRRLPLLLGLTYALFSLSVLGVSVAGVHALVSVMVTGRWREIAIRSALGADPRHTLKIIFSRALLQLAIGCTLGVVGAFQIDRYLSGDLLDEYAPALMLAGSLLMVTVGLLAAAAPARQALLRQPMDVLRED